MQQQLTHPDMILKALLLLFYLHGIIHSQTESIVYKNVNYYSAFPTLIKIDSLNYAVKFRGKIVKDHRDSRGRDITVYSKNQGRIWEIGDVLQNNFVDSIYVPRSGGYISPSIGGWENYGNLDYENLRSNTFKIVSRNLQNNNKTLKIDSFYFVMQYGKPGVCNLGDTLLISFYAKEKLGRFLHPYIARTTDAGNNWSIISIANPTDFCGWSETALVRVNDSLIIALLRPDPDIGSYLYMSISMDAGTSWSVPKKTSLNGFPASMILIDDEKIFAVYGRRHKPYGIFARISKNGGHTWDEHEITVRKPEVETVDLGYPQAIKISNNEVLVVYYITGSDNVTYIESKIVKLN